jgi:hypothetical protein
MSYGRRVTVIEVIETQGKFEEQSLPLFDKRDDH